MPRHESGIVAGSFAWMSVPGPATFPVMMLAQIRAATARNVAVLRQAVTVNPDHGRSAGWSRVESACRQIFTLPLPLARQAALRSFLDKKADAMLRPRRSEGRNLSPLDPRGSAPPHAALPAGEGANFCRICRPNLISSGSALYSRGYIRPSCGKNGKKVNFLRDCCQNALLWSIPLRYLR
jgi:hypothetical protein